MAILHIYSLLKEKEENEHWAIPPQHVEPYTGSQR